MTQPYVHIAGGAEVWMLLHGTGADENDLVPLGRDLFPGSTLVSPRGQVLENGRPRWFHRYAEGEFDLPDFHHRTDELANFVRHLKASGIGTDATWNLLGYSNGANIAHSLLRTHPGLVGDVVLLRPMVIDPDDRAERLKGHRALVAAGRHDLIVPLASAEALAAELRRGGADVDLSVAAAGHELTEFDFLRVRAWLSHR